jgi:hypothetical protein
VLEPYFLKARTFRAARFPLAATWSLTSTEQASTIVRHRFVLKMGTGSFAATHNFKGIARLLVLGTTRRYLGGSTERFHRVAEFMSDTHTRVDPTGIGRPLHIEP